MNDLKLNWSWSENSYPDNALGCATRQASIVGISIGYKYEFTYENVVYDYRQNSTTGELFLCTIGGVAPGTQPTPSGNQTGTGNTGGQSPQPLTNCPLPPRLAVGGQGRVIPGGFPNNIRAVPGLSGDYLGEIPPGTTFTVLAGPQCASNLVWWQISGGGLTGWTAEGQSPEYWLEPLNTTPSGQVLAGISAANVNNAQSTPSGNVNEASLYGAVYASVTRNLIAPSGNRLLVYPAFTNSGTPISATVEGNLAALAVNEAGILVSAELNAQSLNGGIIRVWQLSNQPNTPPTQFGGAATFPSGQVQSIAINGAGNVVAVGINDPNGVGYFVHIVPLASGAPTTDLPLSAPAASLSFSVDGSTLHVLASDGFVTFYNTTTWQITRSFEGFGYVAGQSIGVAQRMAVSSDEKYMALISSNNATGNTVVQIWDLVATTITATLELPAAKGYAQDVAFTSDSSLLAVAYLIPQMPNGGVDLYALPAGGFVRTLSTGNTSRVIVDSGGVLHVFSNTPPEGQVWTIWGIK
jgi:hypothetical protein